MGICAGSGWHPADPVRQPFPAEAVNLLGITLYRLRHHGIRRSTQVVFGTLNHQLAFDPDRIVQGFQGEAFAVFHMDNLVRRWWRYVDTGAVVRHQEELEDAHVTGGLDRKSTRLNSSHVRISYAV